MNLTPQRWPAWAQDLLLIAVAIGVMFAAFDRILTHPNEYLLGGGADGWKNYFTPAWYVEYDSGWWFTGMNYPYGEHVLFTDNQPLISWLMKAVHVLIVPLTGYTTGILNVLVFLGLLICIWLMFHIGRHYGLPLWLSIPGAILITLMSPQIHRFAGHYALAYAPVIPAIWYLALLYLERGRAWGRWLSLLLLMVVFSWIHAYYLLIGALFLLAYGLMYGLMQRPKLGKRAWRPALGLAAAAMLPILLFQVVLWLTDPIADRPPNPFGFLAYAADWRSVFLPVQGPLYEAWHRFAHQWKPSPVEGFAYVGGVATLFALGTLVRWIRYAARGQAHRILRPALPGSWPAVFWASLLLLLFAMCLPFRWLPYDWLEALGPLRQFRSLGRFAWLFYYPFTLYVVYQLYLIWRLLRQRGLKPIGTWMLAAAALFWGWEMAIHVQLHSRATRNFKGDNIFVNQEPDFRAWLAEAGRTPEEFQALLPIPAFQTGSEKFVPRWVTEPTTARAFKLAYNLGLPLACGSMSRTSISQSTRLVQLLASPLIQKTILDDYPDDRPLLMLAQAETALSWEEQQLVKRGKLLVEKGNFSLLELPLSALETDPDTVVARFAARKPALFPAGDGWWLSDSAAFFAFEGYDSQGLTAFGEETEDLQGKEWEIVLYDGPLSDSLRWIASAWVRIDETQSGFPSFRYREFDADGNKIHEETHGIMFGVNTYRDWLRYDYEFTPRPEAARVRLCIFDRKPEVESALIRPARTTVYREGLPGHRLMLNNYYVE